MRKFLVMLALTAAAAGFGFTAEAAYVYDVDYDNNIVSVKGQINGTELNRTAFIAVKNPGDEEVKIDGSQYIIAVNTNSRGEFDTEFKIEPSENSESYMYTMQITSYSGEKYEEEFYFCPADKLMTVLEKIAAAANGDEVNALIQANNDILGFIYGGYSSAGAEAQRDICSGLAAYTRFESAEAFKEAYYDLYIPQAVNNAGDGEKVSSILAEFKKYSKISSLPIYPEFEKIGGLQKNVYTYMLNKQDKNCKEMGVTFTKGVFLQLMSLTGNSAQVQKLAETYANTVGLNLSGVNSLKEPGKVYIEMVGKPYNDIKNVQDDIDRLTALNTSSGGNNGGGSGGGSGNGGSGSKINAGMTVPLEPVEKTEQEYFNDLENTQWAKEAVNGLYEKEIVSGYGNGEFKPANAMTREEFAVLAVKAFGLLDEEAVCEFEDVAEGVWYYRYVASLYQKGLISGMGDGCFGSGENIKRQDAAVLLANISNYKELSLDGSRNYETFADEDNISDYAKESVKKLYEAKIISGSDDGNFYPAKNITRAECCVMIFKMPGIN